MNLSCEQVVTKLPSDPAGAPANIFLAFISTAARASNFFVKKSDFEI